MIIFKKKCIYLISIYVSIYLLEEKFKLIAKRVLALPVSGVVAVTPDGAASGFGRLECDRKVC